MRLYLDMCCYNRPYDDQDQLRIYLETQAVLAIQNTILSGENEMVWSYVLQAENLRNPNPTCRREIEEWRSAAELDISETDEIKSCAKRLLRKGLKPFDALHIACAIAGACHFFITTDKGILNKAPLVQGVRILNPLDFTQFMTGGI